MLLQYFNLKTVKSSAITSEHMENYAVNLQTPAAIGQLHRTQVPHHLFPPCLSQRDLCYMACDQKTWCRHKRGRLISIILVNDGFRIQARHKTQNQHGGGGLVCTREQEERSSIVPGPVAVLSLKVAVKAHSLQSCFYSCMSCWRVRHKFTLGRNKSKIVVISFPHYEDQNKSQTLPYPSQRKMLPAWSEVSLGGPAGPHIARSACLPHLSASTCSGL